MTRSERLAKEGKIAVYVGSFEIATVITEKEMSQRGLRYIGSDYDARYNACQTCANVYEDQDGALYAVID